jgi:trehalose-phosphatase
MARRAATAAGWGERLEVKRTGIVLHTRGLARDRAVQIERDARALWGRFETEGLRLDAIDGGLELRAGQHGKGEVAWDLLRREPDGTLPVFIGDDGTDEQAFRVLRPHGVTIRVGRPHMPTAAEWRVATPDDVANFLHHWATALPRRDP